MIPPTVHGLPSMACVSAMQKCIRRGMEREAMQFAVELMHTSKGFFTMVLNRCKVIVHEDIDVAAVPWIVAFVDSCCELAPTLYAKKPENPGGARMVVGNMIRVLCQAPKSRIGDHFQAAVGLASLLEGFKPEIPDWAFDQHTPKGKRMGRGLDYFRAESAKLVNPDGSAVAEDEYADEAYRLWKLKTEREGSTNGQLQLPSKSRTT